MLVKLTPKTEMQLWAIKLNVFSSLSQISGTLKKCSVIEGSTINDYNILDILPPTGKHRHACITKNCAYSFSNLGNGMCPMAFFW